MSKTAEYDKIMPFIEKMMKEPLSSDECLNIFKQISDQEVEAYKERLKAEIEIQSKDLAIDRKSPRWLLSRALTIIDTVK